MRAFVTGASGFIGSAVAAELARAGHEVVGLVRTQSKARALAAQGVEPLVGDMGEPASWRARAAAAELRVHCAAEYTARYRELDQATAALLAGLSGGLLVYTSGVWIYGATGPESVDETDARTPPPFVAARAEVERLVLASDGGDRRALVVRPGCVFGGQGSLTAPWFESATKQGSARFVGPGSQSWTMVHVSDLAELYRLAAESKLHGEVLNATDGSNASVRECAQAASRAAGAGGTAAALSAEEARGLYGPMAECMSWDQRVSSQKAARLLGWRPRQRTFVEQAETLFRSWQANGPG